MSVPGAELVNKVRSIMEEKLGKGEPALLVISPVINAEFDEHGNIVYKGIEGIELGRLLVFGLRMRSWLMLSSTLHTH